MHGFSPFSSCGEAIPACFNLLASDFDLSQLPESRFSTRNRTSTLIKHLPSTPKHGPSTRKPQKYQILRIKLFRSLNSNRKFTHFVKIAKSGSTPGPQGPWRRLLLRVRGSVPPAALWCAARHTYPRSLPWAPRLRTRLPLVPSSARAYSGVNRVGGLTAVRLLRTSSLT